MAIQALIEKMGLVDGERYDLLWLLEQTDTGEISRGVSFWGHTAKSDEVGKWCMSQWWDGHPFVVGGASYLTAEHWMMAQKAALFGDVVTHAAILQAPTAKEAKALGRQVAHFDADVWQAACVDIVIAGNYHKFAQHADLKAYLLGTGTAVLIEASPIDTIWGVGMAEADGDIHLPAKWQGQNLLGFALMHVRDALNQS